MIVTQDTDLKIRKDNTSTAGSTYIGTALPGTLTSQAKWKIRKVVDATGDTDFANGNESSTNIWDDRVSLTYS